jgi:SAM-dependent methyltransferase
LSHPEQLEFIGMLKLAFPGFFCSGRALEVGSLDINGSIRGFFEGGVYIGLDVDLGPGVDVVCQGQEYDAPDGSFDTVISCEAMEHNPYWKETIANMIRVCRPGGLVVMTCATTGRAEHGTTRTVAADSPLTIGLGWDYYKNLTEQDIMQALAMRDLIRPFAFFTNRASYDLYLVGFKRGASAPAGARRKIAALQLHYRLVNLRISLQTLKKRLLIRLVGEKRYHAGPIRPW